MDNLEDQLGTEGNSRMDIKRETTIAAIKKAILEGANSQMEIGRRTGYSVSTVIKYGRSFEIEIPKGLRGRPKKGLSGYKKRQDIEDLVLAGLTLEEMGKKCNCSRENIRLYLNKSGQRDKWVEARKMNTAVDSNKGFGGKKQLNKLQSSFLSVVRQRTEDLAKIEGFATEKAVEYLISYKVRHPQNHSFNKLYKLFKIYDEAQKKGEKISLYKFANETEISMAGVSYVFSEVGLEPMVYGKQERKITPKEKKQAIKRGFELDFSGKDVSYFLGLAEYVVRDKYAAEERTNGKRYVKNFVSEGALTYRLASQIYEAKDLDFDKNEIIELLDTKRLPMDYALHCRGEIEPKIIDGLKILYNNKDVKTPYVTSEMRSKLEVEE